MTGKLKIVLTASYMVLILASSAIPMDRQVRGLQFAIDLKPAIQNMLHVPAFAILAILFLQVLNTYHIDGWKRNFMVLLSAVCFGIISEAIQIGIPGRYAGITDVGSNFIGAVVGILTYILAEKSRPGLIRRIICG